MKKIQFVLFVYYSILIYVKYRCTEINLQGQQRLASLPLNPMLAQK